MTYSLSPSKPAARLSKFILAGAGFVILSLMAVSGAAAQTSPAVSALTPISKAELQTAKSTDGIIRVALSAYKKGDMERSIRFSQAAIDSGMSARRKAIAYTNMCAAYAQLGQSDKAATACETALTLRPDYKPAAHNLALIKGG